MTRDEYERRKQRIEEQLRAGIALMESAYQAQIRALDLVGMVQAEEAPRSSQGSQASPAQQPLRPPDKPPRKRAPEVDDDIRAAFARLPESFTRGDVCEILGYEPERGALYRSLQLLTRSGALRVESPGRGQRATIYRKTGADLR